MEYLRPLRAANDNLPRGDLAGGTAGFLDAAEAFAGRALFPGAGAGRHRAKGGLERWRREIMKTVAADK